MPELPEVEIIKLGLAKKIIGFQIESIEILEPKKFFGDPKVIIRKKITLIWRKAKVLGIDLEGGMSVMFHLKMSGQIILIENAKRSRFIGGHPTHDMQGALPNKSTRVIFHLNGFNLYFNDQRKFGWVKVISDKREVISDKFLNSLGPEPLDKDFGVKSLESRLKRKQRSNIKQALLDQKVVSGIGNIYACEALFLAKIDPRRKVDSLSMIEIKRLFRGIQETLKAGIKHGGSSKVHFVNADGKKGYFLDYANVYSRQGESCKVCGTKIEKIKLGGRGTVFCPSCQK